MKSKKEVVSELIMILVAKKVKRKNIAKELEIDESTLWRYEGMKINKPHKRLIRILRRMVK